MIISIIKEENKMRFIFIKMFILSSIFGISHVISKWQKYHVTHECAQRLSRRFYCAR